MSYMSWDQTVDNIPKTEQRTRNHGWWFLPSNYLLLICWRQHHKRRTFSSSRRNTNHGGKTNQVILSTDDFLYTNLCTKDSNGTTSDVVPSSKSQRSFQKRSQLVPDSLKSTRNFPKTFLSRSNSWNHSETIPKHQKCFSTILKSSETLPSAQKYFPQLSLIEIIPKLQKIPPNSFSPLPMKSSSYEYTPHPEYQ